MFGFTYIGVDWDGNCTDMIEFATTKEELFERLEMVEEDALCEVTPLFFVTYSRKEIEEYF